MVAVLCVLMVTYLLGAAVWSATQGWWEAVGVALVCALAFYSVGNADVYEHRKRRR